MASPFASQPEFFSSDAALTSVAEYFALLSDPTRLHVLALLCRSKEGLTVSEIVSKSGIRQPNVSRHLGRLYAAGVLTRKRSRTSVVYSVTDSLIDQICDIVYRHVDREQQLGIVETLRL